MWGNSKRYMFVLSSQLPIRLKRALKYILVEEDMICKNPLIITLKRKQHKKDRTKFNI